LGGGEEERIPLKNPALIKSEALGSTVHRVSNVVISTTSTIRPLQWEIREFEEKGKEKEKEKRGRVIPGYGDA